MPILPVSPIPVGWTRAKVEGITFRPSTSSGNPMLQVEVSLESGQLTDIFLVLSTDGGAVARFLEVIGYAKEAQAMIRKRQVPSLELDELIGKELQVYIPDFGMILWLERIDAKLPHTPRPRRF